MKRRNTNYCYTVALTVLIIVLMLPINSSAYDFPKYNYMPPFLSSNESPSVLLVCDTSGSMDFSAYLNDGSTGSSNNTPFDSSKVYYGYFDPYAYYRYVKCRDDQDSTERSGFFEENSDVWTDENGDTHGKWEGNENGLDDITRGVSDPAGTGVGNYEWSGNFLNYISMRRMDILKQVLIGGRRAKDSFRRIIDAAPSNFDSGSDLNKFDYLVVGDRQYETRSASVTDSKAQLPGNDPNKPSDLHHMTPYGTGFDVSVAFSQEYHHTGSSGIYPYYLTFGLPTESDKRKLLAIRIPSGEKPRGIVQQTGAQVRYGVMIFNKSDNQGGRVVVPVGNTEHLCSPVSSSCPSECSGYGTGNPDLGDGFRMGGVIEAINNLSSEGATPLGETLAEAVRYFRQESPSFDSDDFQISKLWDPYFFNMDQNKNCNVGSEEGRYEVCSKGSIILMTDGDASEDNNIPGWVNNYTNGGNSNSREMDDVARYMHITDLRNSDLTHDSVSYNFSATDNTLDLYTIFLFGSGGNLLASSARNGGFIENTGDTPPVPNTTSEESDDNISNEWDFTSPGDGIPDNYFEAEDGNQIESSLISALGDILKRAASGTAASVISGSYSGGGAVYQALFFPKMTEPDGVNSVSWAGYLHSLFKDEYGNIWEDTNGNKTLDIEGVSKDRIVRIVWNEATEANEVSFFTARNPDGSVDESSVVTGGPFDLRDIKTLWEAGRQLSLISDTDSQRSYSSPVGGRHILTEIDGSLIEFSSSRRSTLERYFNLPGEGNSDYISVENLIKWIRGEDVDNYRSRQIDYWGDGEKTWRLGDIIYSTPTIAGPPPENLDLIYNDDAYRQFFSGYKNRRHVILVGANDGMLHAFNGGFYDDRDVSFNTMPQSGTATPYELGQELWAFIPFDLLPHLQALPQTDYDPEHGNHVSFVDLQPRIFDAYFKREGEDSARWRTVLVCGMRFGGGEVIINEGTDDEEILKSSYFALDITDPESPPEFLWSFNDTMPSAGSSDIGENRLGFTTSMPAVVNSYDSSGDISTFVVFGSGPSTLNSTYYTSAESAATLNYPNKSSRKGRFYAVNVATGQPHLIYELPDENSYFGTPAVADLDFRGEVIGNRKCYASDIIYVGTSSNEDGDNDTDPEGKVYRILTMDRYSGNPEPDPSEWIVQEFFDSGKPVTAKPTIGAAGKMVRGSTYKARLSGGENEFSIPMVYFGTGEFFFSEDKDDRSNHFFYGINEPVTINSAYNHYEFEWVDIDDGDLMDVSSTLVYTNGSVDITGDGINSYTVGESGALPSMTTPPHSDGLDPPDYSSWIDYLTKSDLEYTSNDRFSRYRGWKNRFDISGERLLGKSSVLGGALIYSSYLPSDEVCLTSGESFIHIPYYLTGAAFYKSLLGEDLSCTISDETGTYNKSIEALSLGNGLAAEPVVSISENGSFQANIQTSNGEIVQRGVDPAKKVLGPGVHMRSWLLR